MTARPRVKASPAKKTATKKTAASKVKAAKKAPSKSKRVTIESVSTQIESLAKQVRKLKKLVRRALETKSAALEKSGVDDGVDAEDEAPQTPVDAAQFGDDLLKVLAELDRRGRHDGLVPIPEVRQEFLGRGWTRRTFDDRLLQAERDFIIDLKTADDPRLLAAPDLAIRERGRGHLQYVVVR